jgi:hypothetical protein
MKHLIFYVVCGLFIGLVLPSCGGGSSAAGASTNKLTVVGAGS